MLPVGGRLLSKRRSRQKVLYPPAGRQASGRPAKKLKKEWERSTRYTSEPFSSPVTEALQASCHILRENIKNYQGDSRGLRHVPPSGKQSRNHSIPGVIFTLKRDVSQLGKQRNLLTGRAGGDIKEIIPDLPAFSAVTAGSHRIPF